jgi:hypothetical protein
MTGGGGDEMRSGYTARVVVITEVDKMDEASDNSREADPITQIEARTSSFAGRAVSYKECTVSIEEGRIWRDYHAGSAAKIVCPCPHCHAWVTPEREHFRGVRDAATVMQAGRQAHFVCPACEEQIAEAQRRTMNAESRVIHRGQLLEADRTVVGDMPDTDMLGFRWSAFNNLFWETSHIGKLEFESRSRKDQDAAEREARQFRWTVPYVPDNSGETIVVAVEDVIRRTVPNFPRGYVPTDTRWITIGMDVGKRECYWAAIAWRRNQTGHVIDYGIMKVAADEMGFRLAFHRALLGFHAHLGRNWTIPKYTRVFVDSRWSTDDVLAGLDNLEDGRWWPSVGMGAGHWKFKRYVHPQKIIKNRIIAIGDGYHEKIGERRRVVFNIDANQWKSKVQEALVLPYSPDTDEITKGAVTLFAANPEEHITFAEHMGSEKQVSKFVPGEGTIMVWECPSGNNHWLDAVYLAMVAGHRCGFRFADDEAKTDTVPRTDEPDAITMPDGREYLATHR